MTTAVQCFTNDARAKFAAGAPLILLYRTLSAVRRQGLALKECAVQFVELGIEAAADCRAVRNVGRGRLGDRRKDRS